MECMECMDPWAVPYRWSVRARFPNGGRAAVTLAVDADFEEVEAAVRDYLRRGASNIEVQRFLPVALEK